jgi:hypothetical protein
LNICLVTALRHLELKWIKLKIPLLGINCDILLLLETAREKDWEKVNTISHMEGYLSGDLVQRH